MDNEEKLLQLEQRLLSEGVTHNAIREPDAPFCNSIMAIGAKPMPRSEIKKHFSGLSLLR